MNCDEFKDLIGDYLDEEVAQELCEEVKRHLKACGFCGVEVDTLKKTILIYRKSSKPASLSDDARRRLYKVLSYEYRSASTKAS